MMKYHDVKTKGGLDFAEHLVAYYRAKESYFKDGNTLLQALKIWESKLSKDITEVWCTVRVQCIWEHWVYVNVLLCVDAL